MSRASLPVGPSASLPLRRFVGAGERLLASSSDIEWSLTFALLGIGFGLRARGYLFKPVPFWLDECSWARRLLTRPLSEMEIRPIGFMAATRGLVHLFSASETWFRFLPWCSGIAIMLMTPFIARRLLESAPARLLLIASVALHPGAIDLSKEFKPYSVGLALHAALVLFGLRYAISGKTRDLVQALLFAVPAVLFAQDVLFAYPGLFFALGFSALNRRRLSHLLAIGAGGAAAFALTLALYLFMWKGASSHEATTSWGHKYDVFYLHRHSATTLQAVRWFARKYAELAVLPGVRLEFLGGRGASVARQHWLSLLAVLWLGLNLAGLANLVRKRQVVAALLLVTPIATLMLCNVLRLWPFGAFRTNLFALAYMSPTAAMGLELVYEELAPLARRLGWSGPLGFAPALLLVTAPLLAFDRSLGGSKRAFSGSSQFPTAVERLLELRTDSSPSAIEPVVFDEYTCRSWAFYSRFHPRFSTEVTPRLLQHFSFDRCRQDDSFDKLLDSVRHDLRRNDRVWIVAESAAVRDSIERSWPADLEQSVREVIHGSDAIVLGVKLKR